MGKAKIRTITTIVFMIILSIVILLFYYYWTNRTDPIDSSGENLTEVEKLINKDLELYYPETPREVTKLFASMMKALYNNPEDDEIEALATKIRELYDKEFLDNNPEATYLTSLYADISKWKDKNRKITNYLLINEDQEQEKEIDGVKYSTKFISFTIQENIKFIETWQVLLREDANKQWKILGWELVTDSE
ncbi:MAG: hypothetical protein PHF63_06685 [Herbinix sp.]|nr:hypothetical protein [Herbinix sp.]